MAGSAARDHCRDSPVLRPPFWRSFGRAHDIHAATAATACCHRAGGVLMINMQCLQGENLVCDAGTCVEGTPSPEPECGTVDTPCCAPDGPAGGECTKEPNLKCMNGMCQIAACGDPGWPCCRPDGPEGGECPKVRAQWLLLLSTCRCACQMDGQCRSNVLGVRHIW